MSESVSVFVWGQRHESVLAKRAGEVEGVQATKSPKGASRDPRIALADANRPTLAETRRSLPLTLPLTPTLVASRSQSQPEFPDKP